MKTASVDDTWSLVSSSHPGWRSNTTTDSGGAFSLTKTSTFHSPGSWNGSLLQGQFLCGAPSDINPEFPAYASYSDLALNAKGTTAIARTEPTKSVSDVATFIGELRAEGLPRLRPEVLKASTKKAKAAGSDYLNVEFGWRPIVNDLQKFFTAVRDADSIIQSYREHGKGQKLRRRYAFPTRSETASRKSTVFIPVPIDVDQFGSGVQITQRQEDMWFSGAYRYYIPVADSTSERLRGYASNVQKLFGVSLTPEVIWNLEPWSWLVDWQTNVGDVFHNISAMGRDGLVLQYGYVMAHQSYTISRCALFTDASRKISAWASSSSTSETKKRIPATPYGFGVNLGGLTARQGAILAALGLAKS